MTMAFRALLGACAIAALTAGASAQTTLTIATVNNSDMIRMQGLTDDFTKANPDITLQWVTLEENVLRQRVTTDIATKGGQFDVLTIGTYEVPIWAKQGWLVPLENLGADYDVDDLLPPIRAGLTYEGKLYAAPFYGESSMIMYRKDLFDAAGIKMPDSPTWDSVADAARKLTDKSKEIYGICLRGKAGWGENMAFLTAMSNSFGARWFDENWKPQFDQQPWKDTLTFYVNLMNDAGPPGASSNGFNENLALFNSGKCAHVDRRDRRRLVRHQPEGILGRRQGRLRARAEHRQGQERQLAVGVVARHSRRLAEGRGRGEVHRLGDLQALHRARRLEGRLGQRSSGHAHLALQQPGIRQGAVRQDDDRTRSTRPTRRSRRSIRCPIPACSSSRSPSSRGSARRSARSFRRRLPVRPRSMMRWRRRSRPQPTR